MIEVFHSIGLMPILLMSATIFIAAILRAFTGFGFALAALPVLSHIFDPTLNVFLMAALTITVSMMTVRTYWHHVSLPPLALMLVLSAIGTAVGIYILLIISPEAFKLAIGITVMLACLILTRFKPHAGSKSGGPKASIAGLLSGILNGAIAIPGPPVIIYALAVIPDPIKSRAFLMVFFIFSSVFVIAGFIYEGLITEKSLFVYAAALPAMIIGDKMGFWLFDRYGNAAYRKIGLIALFLIGTGGVVGALL